MQVLSKGSVEVRMKGNNILILLLLTCFAVFISNGCKDKEEATPAQETGTVTDIENNVYKTVKIGKQWWMMENLKVTKFRNGFPVTQAQSDSDWQTTTAAYCEYDDNERSPGLLYNYYTVSDTNNIAPVGWHIPTDNEWKVLEQFLGMNAGDIDKVNWRGDKEGNKLKIEGPNGWTIFENVWGTNESGFSALAGSCRMFNGAWGNPGLFCTGFWWSSTLHENEAWYRYLDYKKTGVFRFYGSRNYGFSIRCVKD